MRGEAGEYLIAAQGIGRTILAHHRAQHGLAAAPALGDQLGRHIGGAKDIARLRHEKRRLANDVADADMADGGQRRQALLELEEGP
ncbi:hypothetical protein D3C72_1844930 [compost metagenome]